MLKHWRYFIPIIVVLSFGIVFWYGLHRDPRILPSVLIGKPVPSFSLPALQVGHENFSTKALRGQVSIVNVWASWCESCLWEHPMLMDIAKRYNVKIYGINYRDNRQDAINWLAKYGDPYQAVGFDANGRVAIDWGVYGTPETYIVDQKGIIRYKNIGVITEQQWHERILPLIKKLSPLPQGEG